MSDVGTLIDFNHSVITVSSQECLGIQVATGTLTYSTAAAWPTSNLAQYVPVLIGYPITIQKMFWENGATVGNNSVDIGIYDSQGNQLVHSGSTATSGATSVQSVTVTTTTLQPGLYYMGFAVNGTTDTFVSWSFAATSFPRIMGIYQQTTAFPLPAVATFATNAQSNFPMIGMTTKTVV